MTRLVNYMKNSDAIIAVAVIDAAVNTVTAVLVAAVVEAEAAVVTTTKEEVAVRVELPLRTTTNQLKRADARPNDTVAQVTKIQKENETETTVAKPQTEQ